MMKIIVGGLTRFYRSKKSKAGGFMSEVCWLFLFFHRFEQFIDYDGGVDAVGFGIE